MMFRTTSRNVKNETTHSKAPDCLTIITQLHSKNPVSEGMQRPIDGLIRSLEVSPIICILGDEQAPQSWPTLSKMSIDIPKPYKNIALDFLAGLFGRYRTARRRLSAEIGKSSRCIVSYRASPLLIRSATLLKSDLFSVNYRRRVGFCISRVPLRLPVEIVKLVLAYIQEATERVIYGRILLHSMLEINSRRRYLYLPIIASPITCNPASELVVRDGKILVVGYQPEDVVANADTDEILAQIISETNNSERIFYLGRKSGKIGEANQSDWVEAYEAFLHQFSVAIYARRVCSGAHNKIVDLLKNGCVVYCPDEMRSAFATPCRYLRSLESFRQDIGVRDRIQYNPEHFRNEVDRFFQEELKLHQEVVQAIQDL